MDQPSLYDDDSVTWAEQQASTLRELARRPDPANIVDRENVAGEIESAGRSQIDAAERQLLQTLVHVPKTARLQAEASRRTSDDRRVAGLPGRMPFTPGELVAETFTMDWALERLAATLNRPPDQH
ncbi:hypothetical protein ASF49_06600 [Methylobacterium sp. Leaf104]|uniref:DUF29 family protein n=1 Tax=Methylobacterium TaxID=407 RepID=UPI0006F47B11|nr:MULTISPECIES: DUF29 family protein [Methylobacterium]KQP33559.1 hypothetical protein ASF49_06600 [Methylobacterium sp. Leaf104]MCI9879914.1 DUF29 family protein [Methylobacterium goesingense]